MGDEVKEPLLSPVQACQRLKENERGRAVSQAEWKDLMLYWCWRDTPGPAAHLQNRTADPHTPAELRGLGAGSVLTVRAQVTAAPSLPSLTLALVAVHDTFIS